MSFHSHNRFSFYPNGDFSIIRNAYRRVCESVELDALKHRLESASPNLIKQSFYEMSAKDKVEEMMKSGAVVEKLGSSSRIALLTNDGTVLKIADNEAGLAQNAAEAYNASEKNAYGCFAKVLWVSRNRFALEMEYAEKLDGSDLEFEDITGTNLDKYFDYLRYEKYLSRTPKKKDVVYRAHLSRNKDHVTADLEWIKENHDEIAVELRSGSPTEAKGVLVNLANYLRTHTSPADFSFRDVGTANNRGKVKRNGEDVCVVLDHGASERVLNHVYHGLDTTGLQSYVR